MYLMNKNFLNCSILLFFCIFHTRFVRLKHPKEELFVGITKNNKYPTWTKKQKSNLFHDKPSKRYPGQILIGVERTKKVWDIEQSDLNLIYYPKHGQENQIFSILHLARDVIAIKSALGRCIQYNHENNRFQLEDCQKYDKYKDQTFLITDDEGNWAGNGDVETGWGHVGDENVIWGICSVCIPGGFGEFEQGERMGIIRNAAALLAQSEFGLQNNLTNSNFGKIHGLSGRTNALGDDIIEDTAKHDAAAGGSEKTARGVTEGAMGGIATEKGTTGRINYAGNQGATGGMTGLGGRETGRVMSGIKTGGIAGISAGKMEDAGRKASRKEMTAEISGEQPVGKTGMSTGGIITETFGNKQISKNAHESDKTMGGRDNGSKDLIERESNLKPMDNQPQTNVNDLFVDKSKYGPGISQEDAYDILGGIKRIEHKNGIKNEIEEVNNDSTLGLEKVAMDILSEISANKHTKKFESQENKPSTMISKKMPELVSPGPNKISQGVIGEAKSVADENTKLSRGSLGRTAVKALREAAVGSRGENARDGKEGTLGAGGVLEKVFRGASGEIMSEGSDRISKNASRLGSDGMSKGVLDGVLGEHSTGSSKETLGVRLGGTKGKISKEEQGVAAKKAIGEETGRISGGALGGVAGIGSGGSSEGKSGTAIEIDGAARELERTDDNSDIDDVSAMVQAGGGSGKAARGFGRNRHEKYEICHKLNDSKNKKEAEFQDADNRQFQTDALEILRGMTSFFRSFGSDRSLFNGFMKSESLEDQHMEQHEAARKLAEFMESIRNRN